jgi:methionyl-tRNA formyltransferase
MGTPEFAVPPMLAINEKYNLQAVVTVPDKPQGRGKQIKGSAVKEAAEKLGVEILQPESLKDPEFINKIAAYNPDLIVVIAFRILPQAVYSLARLGAFNIHGSLLPKYRGAAPINWAIINGDKKTGLTSFLLKPEVDAGDLLLQTHCEIGEETTFGELYESLMNQASQLCINTIELIQSGNYSPKMQDESLISKAPKIFSDDCKIDWSKSATEIKNLINGVSPAPGAWTLMDGQRIKILRAGLAQERITGKIGEYVANKKEFKVICGNDSAILVREIQFPGKKAQKINDYLNGKREDFGGIFEY